MKLPLKGFQEVAVDDLTRRVRAAQQSVGLDPQAVVLSAPTGAGKTVIATALIERLLDGDDDSDGDPKTTVLWLTDDPDLNEQTLRKIRDHSSVIGEQRLVTLGLDFDEQAFPSGCVYFLNTQKLGKNSNMVRKRGDKRFSTLWETIENTSTALSGSFIVVLDEAHRGMGQSQADVKRAETIVQEFVKGSSNISPVPLVVGISATPDRFATVLAGSPRAVQPRIDVPAEEVRASGLLKERLLVWHPSETQKADWTLLATAAQSMQEYAKAWSDYHERSKTAETVVPVLVVQVEDARGGKANKNSISATDLGRALTEIEGVLGPLDEHAVGHCFQEHTAVLVGDRAIRYVRPPDVQTDADLRVVFFKSALTTGWDCPRAEVMMSFRKAVDDVLIAQLVGRMVRTPLARRIEDDEYLNTVSLYLPHYDEEGITKVLQRLAADDPTIMPPTKVVAGKSRVRLSRNPDLKVCFDRLSSVPSYDVARVRKESDVRRVIKFARLLARDKVAPDADDKARGELVAVLESARNELEETDWWQKVVTDADTIDLRQVDWSMGQGTTSEKKQLVQASAENVEDLFRVAGRKLGEGLHKAYWRARATHAPTTKARRAKLEVFALTCHDETMATLESVASAEMDALTKAHGSAISALPADRKDAYHQVRLTAKDPEPRMMELPVYIEGTKADTSWESHLYVANGSKFTYDFRSTWEPLVLKSAMDAQDFVGWLRNEDRKQWSLTVPYRINGETRAFFPDLIVFRSSKDSLLVDILDPHDPGRDDWLPKVHGLADYAAKHAVELGGVIEAIFVEGKTTIRRLDLSVPSNRQKALATKDEAYLRSLFV